MRRLRMLGVALGNERSVPILPALLFHTQLPPPFHATLHAGDDGDLEGGLNPAEKKRASKHHTFDPEATLESDVAALNLKQQDLVADSAEPLFQSAGQFEDGSAQGVV